MSGISSAEKSAQQSVYLSCSPCISCNILRTPPACKSSQNADCSAYTRPPSALQSHFGPSCTLQPGCQSQKRRDALTRSPLAPPTRPASPLCSGRRSSAATGPSASRNAPLQEQQQQSAANRPMGISEFFHSVWDLVRRPFEECTSCCDVLDPNYYRKTSPGVRRSPQMFNRFHDVKYDLSKSRPPSLLPPSSSSSHAGVIQRSNRSADSGSRSGSRSASPMNYSYEEEEEKHVQFLFYGGSDPPTPTSAALGGYRSDMISNYVEPVSPAAFASPRINHEMPCFFSPRDIPAQSPMSAPIYSPHLFKISEQRQRRSAGNYSRYSR